MKLIFKIIAWVITLSVIAAAAYLAYVLIAYHRIADNQALDVSGGASETVEPDETYAITTFNIGYGAYGPEYSFFMDGGKYSRALSREDVLQNTDGAIGVIQGLKPDFAFFQEVDTDSTRSYHVDQLTALEAGFPAMSPVFAMNYDSPYLFYPLTDPIGKSVSGIVTLSDCAVSSSLRRSLPLESGFRKLIDLDRCYSVTRLPVSNGRELILINVHLSAFTADVTIGEAQLKMLFEDAGREYAAGNYVVIGGDFNKDLLGNSPEVFHTTREVPNWAKPLNEALIPDGFTRVSPENAADLIPTLRATDKPYVEGESFVTVLDGFIVSDNVGVVHEEHVDAGFAFSDHNPVLMQFTLKS